MKDVKKTICVECMNEMSKTSVGYFCPMCRFGHPDDKSSQNHGGNNNVFIGHLRPNGNHVNEPFYGLPPPRNAPIRRNAVFRNPDVPAFQQFLAAIRQNNYEEVCYYMDSGLVNPADQNNRAYILAISSGANRRIIDKLSSDRRVDIMAFEKRLNNSAFNYSDYLSGSISSSNNHRDYHGNWASEYDLGRPYF